MGKHSDSLKSRFNLGPKNGYCVICGGYGKLTRDHVPPKGCNNLSNHQIKSLFPKNGAPARGLTSQGGTHFRTICGNCNGGLLGGRYDPSLISLSNEITSLADSLKSGVINLPPEICAFVKPQRIARSIVGHLLAANSAKEAKDGLVSSPVSDALRKYFLDESSSFPDKMELYYWLYPSRRQIIVKGFGRKESFNSPAIIGHVIKFLPLGFWLVSDKPDTVKINLPKLFKKKSIGIDDLAQIIVPLHPLQPEDFPEAPGEKGIIALNNENTSVALPAR